MKSLTNWRSHQARSPLQIAMTGKQTPPSSQHCPWKLCQGHSRMISCSSQQPMRQGQRNQCCWTCSSTGECRVGCLSHGVLCHSCLCLKARGQTSSSAMLGTMKREVRVSFLSGEPIGKVTVLLEKWLQQNCSNTATKLVTSSRNLISVSLLVGPAHFFKALTFMFPKGISFWQFCGSVRL